MPEGGWYDDEKATDTGSMGIADSAADLNEGDHAVHLDYGICIFKGLEVVESGGAKAEMIALEFADDMVMHVPLWQAHLLSRYIGAGKKGVALSNVKSSRWGKTRAAAAVSVQNMAYAMIQDGTLYDLRTIRAIDEILGTELMMMI